MGRRAKTTSEAPKQFKYASVAECETESDFHEVEPRFWPPRPTSSDPIPSMSLQCRLCNGWCIVSANNDEAITGIRVIVPERKPKGVPA